MPMPSLLPQPRTAAEIAESRRALSSTLERIKLLEALVKRNEMARKDHLKFLAEQEERKRLNDELARSHGLDPDCPKFREELKQEIAKLAGRPRRSDRIRQLNAVKSIAHLLPKPRTDEEREADRRRRKRFLKRVEALENYIKLNNVSRDEWNQAACVSETLRDVPTASGSSSAPFSTAIEDNGQYPSFVTSYDDPHSLLDVESAQGMIFLSNNVFLESRLIFGVQGSTGRRTRSQAARLKAGQANRYVLLINQICRTHSYDSSAKPSLRPQRTLPLSLL
ncbi:hypothetical protein H0H93_007620 [Arthromyces matolae]|nr:hypothetical protein H0H93_007620 [Arthromyces matolae]